MNTTYQIIFKGDILKNYNVAEVKNNFARLYQISPQQVGIFFSGKEIVLKEKLSSEQVKQYVTSFRKRGIHVIVKEEQRHDDLQKVTTPNPSSLSNTSSTQTALYHNNTPDTYENYYSSPETFSEPLLKSSEKNEAEPPEIFGKSFEGRYGRLNFANAYVIILGITLGLLAILFLLKNTPIPQKILYRVGGIIALAGFGFSSRACGLRLRDINISEWFYAPMFAIPLILELFFRVSGLYTWLIFIVTLILMLTIPGSSSKNKYGEVSRRGSPVGLIVLIACGVIAGMSILVLLIFLNSSS